MKPRDAVCAAVVAFVCLALAIGMVAADVAWPAMLSGYSGGTSIAQNSCSANQFATSIDSTGTLSCTQPTFSNISGTAAVTQGGTGLTTVATNDLLYGSATNTLARLALPTQPTDPVSYFTTETPNQTASGQYEFGLKFRTSIDGKITHIKLWADSANRNNGTVARIWSSNGTELASVTFDAASSYPGWQSKSLAAPLSISANTDYVVSAWGNYDWPYSSIVFGTRGYISILQSYFGVRNAFPTNAFSLNYYRDIVFSTGEEPANRYLRYDTASSSVKWDKVDLTYVSSSLAPANGGTGLTSYTWGDTLYSCGSGTLCKLPRPTASPRYLLGPSNTGEAPSWSSIDLAAGVTSTLPVGNGGTGQTTFTEAGRVVVSTSATALAGVPTPAPSSTPAYLQFTGGSTPSWGKVRLADGVTGNLPVGNLAGGSGAGPTTFWRGDGSWATPAASNSSVQVFSANGSWTAPTAFTPAYVHMWCVGGGGSGGSGSSVTTSGNSNGGGGGGSGGTCEVVQRYSDLTGKTPLSVTIAASVPGALGVASGTIAGVTGNYGQESSIQSSDGTRMYCRAFGGNAGGGGGSGTGTAAAASGGAGATGSPWAGGAGGKGGTWNYGNTTSGFDNLPLQNINQNAPGAGGGATGGNSSSAISPGAAGGRAYGNTAPVPTPTPLASGVNAAGRAGANGANGSNYILGNGGSGGTGGTATVVGGAGGSGGTPGGGGGGGGGSVTGAGSGAGGAGGAGICIITSMG